ncbi:MAG: hypothetical protein IJQ07_07890 [Clostridia bacterium]|nr:hypothetical protein [Clostridia bacterium]
MTFTKKICLLFLTVLSATCFIFFATATFNKNEAKADVNPLEAEFTNDGQFALKQYSNIKYNYVDGASEGLPEGYSGVVLKVNNINNNSIFVTIDCSSSQILAENIESIVVRIYSPGYTSADEFRTLTADSVQRYYGAGKYDMSTWCNISLNANSIADMTDSDGYLTALNVGVRIKSGAAVYYFDSITINEKVDVEALEAEFTNNGQFAVGNTSWGGTHEFIDGTSVGGTGAVLKAEATAGTSGFRLDFTGTGLRAEDVESIVVRLKADNFTKGSDEFRTSNDGGTHWVQYGKTDDLSDWFDYTLNAKTMAQLTNEDGTLGYTDIVIRAYTAGLILYVDSVTVNEKVDVEALEAVFTNNGQFEIKASVWGNAYEFIIGTSVDGTGAVLKVGFGSNVAAFRLDLTNSGLYAKDVESIVVRLKADNFTLGSDEFRTSNDGGTHWVQYGKTDDLSDWFDYTLNAKTMAQLTNEDGTLGYTDIAIRTNNSTLILYIDSITVNEKEKTPVNYLKIEWNNKGYGEPFAGKNGILIKFDANLSTVKNEIDGGLQSVNLNDEYGKYITLNGEKLDTMVDAELKYHSQGFLWIYAPDMTAWENHIPIIVIEENTPFLDAILPALTLYFNGDTNKWQTECLTIFGGVDESSSANTIVLKFTDDVVWSEDVGNIAEHILLDGKTLAEDGGSVSLDATEKTITVNTNGTYRKVALSDGAVCGDVEIPEIILSVIDGGWMRVYSYVGTKIESSNGALDNNNYLGSDNLYATTLDFDAKVMDWNTYPTAVSGIKINGIELGSSTNEKLGVRLIQLTDGLWVKFKANLESGYNGYSHPTITFDYSAYIETENHERVYFDEVELYLENDAWSTTIPDEYVVIKQTTFVGIDASSSANKLVLNFTDDIDWTEDVGDIAEHIFLDGKTLAEDGGSVFINAAKKTITVRLKKTDKKYGAIVFTAGGVFGELMLPGLNIYGFYDGEWQDDGHFTCTNFKGWYENLPFVEIPYGWNCVQSVTLKGTINTDTILRFGNYEKHYFATVADQNDISKQLGDGITVNGVPIGQIKEASVSYAHGFNHLYISVPVYELCPTDEYKCVELRVKANAAFKDVILGEVVLYLVDGKWQTEKPVTVDVDKEGTYFTAKDIFNGENGGYFEDGAYLLTDVDDEKEIVSSKIATSNSVIYNFLYKAKSVDFDYSLFTYVGEEFRGVRVAIYRNLNESVQGFNVYVDGKFEGAKQIAFVPDEWYAVRFAITVNNGVISVSIAVDGLEIINVKTEYIGEIGNGIKFKKVYGTLEFADFKTGDIKNPVIYWQGKRVNRFTVGEDKPSDFIFTRVLRATDNYDKVNFSAEDFIIEWQDGAIKDGKLVAGEWTITVSVSDKTGNIGHFTTTALVIKPDEIAVAFNVDGEVVYSVNTKGALIEMPSDPIKEGDTKVNYIFDGWYFGEQKWDFANDHAFTDIELNAVFTTVFKEYSVTIVSAGLEKNYEYTFKLHYGCLLDKSVLTRDGYSYKLTENDKIIDSITVNGDMRIVAVYTPETVPQQSGCGCGGSVSGSIVGLSMAVIACMFISLKRISNKRDKEHE